MLNITELIQILIFYSTSLTKLPYSQTGKYLERITSFETDNMIFPAQLLFWNKSSYHKCVNIIAIRKANISACKRSTFGYSQNVCDRKISTYIVCYFLFKTFDINFVYNLSQIYRTLNFYMWYIIFAHCINHSTQKIKKVTFHL